VRLTVKICGLTTLADAREAVKAGADYVGFVFFPSSLRCVPVEACAWIRTVEGAGRVGVFRNQSESFVRRIRDEARLDLVQLHGDEPPELCTRLGGRDQVVKAIPVSEVPNWFTVLEYARVARILFDTASPTGGGTGRTFNWRLVAHPPQPLPFLLAGGLRPDNVAAAIAAVKPAGVDVATGVEASMGKKDHALVRAFVAAVRAAAGEGP